MGCCCSVDDDATVPPPSSAQTYGGGSRQNQRPFGGSGNTLGGNGVVARDGVNATDAAAAAALERANNATGKGASERDRKMAERRQKDELVGRIYAWYNQAGKDPPIGLASSSIEQLRKHLDYIKGDAARTAKTNKLAASMNI